MKLNLVADDDRAVDGGADQGLDEDVKVNKDIFSNHQRHHHHKHRHQQHHHYHHLDEDVKVCLRRGGGVAHGDPHVVETGEVLE